MKLGQWHHRRGGQWMVERTPAYETCDLFVIVFAWLVALLLGDVYHWKANNDRHGYARFAFLARRRAIAALKRMADNLAAEAAGG